MRFLIHEMAYERPIAAGRLVYQQGGDLTGAAESWRLTEALDRYQFLRVDLDAREAPSGSNWLYHLTLGPEGQPEQLKFRYWDVSTRIRGNLVWSNDEVFGTRIVNQRRYDESATGEIFWFPSVSGLSRLGQSTSNTGNKQVMCLKSSWADPEQALSLVKETAEISLGAEGADGMEDAETLLTVAWNNQRRIVWLDSTGHPLRLERQDGLTAVADQLIHYQ